MNNTPERLTCSDELLDSEVREVSDDELLDYGIEPVTVPEQRRPLGGIAITAGAAQEE